MVTLASPPLDSSAYQYQGLLILSQDVKRFYISLFFTGKYYSYYIRNFL